MRTHQLYLPEDPGTRRQIAAICIDSRDKDINIETVKF